MVFDFRSIFWVRFADRIDDLVGSFDDRHIYARIIHGQSSFELERQVRLISLSTNQMPVGLLDDLGHLLFARKTILQKSGKSIN